MMNAHVEYSDKTPLHQAAILGNTAIVEELLSSGVNPDARTRRGRTALHYAAENGHNGILGLLLGSGAQIDLPNKWGRTALHYAASKHWIDCIQTLLNRGADPNKQDVDGQTPLYHAVAASAWQTHEEAEIFFFKVCYTEVRNTSVCGSVVDDSEMRDLEVGDNKMCAKKMSNAKVGEIISLLMSHEANADTPDKSGITPLHVAAELGNAKICTHLVEDGKAQIDALDQHEATPLHYACYQGHGHITKLLLSHGASSNVRDHAGLLPEMYSAKRRKYVLTPLHADGLWGLPPSRSTIGKLNSCDKKPQKVPRSATRGIKGKTEELIQTIDAEALKEKSQEPHSTKEVDFNSWLLLINGTEGVGLVQRTLEVERMEQDICHYIEATLKDMALADPRLSYVVLKAGSTAENTKIGDPDEIDYMCCLTGLSSVCYPWTSSSDPPGYLRIKLHNQGIQTWRDVVNNDGFVVADKLHQLFHSVFDRLSENSDLTAMSTCLHKLRNYSGGSDFGVTVDMSQTKPGSRLYFLWRGCQFKRMVVMVDLIPAVEIIGWPQSAKVPPLQGCRRYHVIPKVSPEVKNHHSVGLFWRISTSVAERCLFSEMDSPARACYTVCKSLVHSPNPQRLLPDDSFSLTKDFQELSFVLHRLRSHDGLINSYLLKMILLRLRNKYSKICDWSWSNVGHRVLQILNKLLGELEQGYVPSFFILDYNVLNKETFSE